MSQYLAHIILMTYCVEKLFTEYGYLGLHLEHYFTAESTVLVHINTHRFSLETA